MKISFLSRPITIHPCADMRDSAVPQGPLECSKTKFGSGALLRARCHGPRHRRCCWFGYCPLGWAAALLRGWRLECSGGRNHCLWLLGAAAGASRSCSTASGLALRLLAHYILDFVFFYEVLYVVLSLLLVA